MTKQAIDKPYFKFITKKENPGYAKDCYVHNFGTIREIRCYGPNIYYTTIQGMGQKFNTPGEAIKSNLLYN